MPIPSLPVAAPRARDLAILEHVQWQPPGTAALWSRPISLAFANERCGLVGRNGSGKSALCRLLAGVVNPSAGRVQRLAEVAHVPTLLARSWRDSPLRVCVAPCVPPAYCAALASAAKGVASVRHGSRASQVMIGSHGLHARQTVKSTAAEAA